MGGEEIKKGEGERRGVLTGGRRKGKKSRDTITRGEEVAQSLYFSSYGV